MRAKRSEFRAQGLFCEHSRGPRVIGTFKALAPETVRRFLEPFDVADRERAVAFEIPGIAQPEIAQEFARKIGLKRVADERNKALLGRYEMHRRVRYIKEGECFKLSQ